LFSFVCILGLGYLGLLKATVSAMSPWHVLPTVVRSFYELLNVVGDSCESTLVLKRQAGILSMTFQFIRDTVIFLLTYAK